MVVNHDHRTHVAWKNIEIMRVLLARMDRVDIHDDLMDQIREVHLISDLLISSSEIDEDTARGVGTMLCHRASDAADLADKLWKPGGAS